MGRAAQFSETDIVDAARAVTAESGPTAATIQRIAQALGAPSGSIYHRFDSRDGILARVWIESVTRFQQAFAATSATATAGELAAFVVQWTRTHPTDARILLLYRRSELLRPRVPPDLRRQAEALGRHLESVLRAACRRWLGSTAAEPLAAVRLAVVEIPMAALVSRLRHKRKLPRYLERHICAAADAAIQAAR